MYTIIYTFTGIHTITHTITQNFHYPIYLLLPPPKKGTMCLKSNKLKMAFKTNKVRNIVEEIDVCMLSAYEWKIFQMIE